MSIYAVSGAAIEAVLQSQETGKAGVYRVSILDTPGSTYWLNPTITGIVESPAGSAVYAWSGTAPVATGAYSVVWDAGTTSQVLAVEDLIVSAGGVQPVGPSGGDLCTVADVRQALELPNDDVSRDSLIGTLITDMSKAIISEVDREFAPATASATRRFRLGANSMVLDMSPYDLRVATAVVLNPESPNATTLTATTDYQLTPFQPQNGTYLAIRFAVNQPNLHTSDTARDFGYTLVDVTGSWGFPTVPSDVRRACVIAVTASLRRDLAEFAIAGIDEPQAIAPEGPASYSLPPASRRLLAPYRRTGGAF